MPNKRVTDPCPMSGQTIDETVTTWVMPSDYGVTTRIPCPECYAVISLNRVSKTVRTHNKKHELLFPSLKQVVIEPFSIELSQRELIQSFE